MLPVEVRIFPTVEVIANLKMLDSYAGLTLPLMASATATFLFRQFFMTYRMNWWKPRGSTARRQCVSFATSFSAVQNQSGGAVCDHLYLRLEPVFVVDC